MRILRMNRRMNPDFCLKIFMQIRDKSNKRPTTIDIVKL